MLDQKSISRLIGFSKGNLKGGSFLIVGSNGINGGVDAGG